MPRLARTVCARVPHHVTQRGNRRETVFFTDDDRQAYLGWLQDYAEKHEVEVLAYCLMSNHIHLVAVPKTEDGLQGTLKPLHMRYAQRINRTRGWKGHLWQGRFFSSALDEDYLWAASVMSSATRCGRGWCARPRTIAGPAPPRTADCARTRC